MSESVPSTRFRSPPFPALPLPRALERAEQLYRAERDHLVPLASAARAWGMSPTSSGPIQVVAALLQYGLASDEGSGPARKLRLNQDALRLIIDKIPNSQERQQALRRAFLAPKVFSEIWEQWGGDLPTDHTIINHLVLDRKLKGNAPFSEQAAAELLANYRASLPFAGMLEMPIVPPTVEPSEATLKAETAPEPLPQADVQTQSPRIPLAALPVRTRGQLMEHERVLSDGILSKTATYRLIVSGQVGLKEIERLIKKLEIDKEILAEDDDDAQSHDITQ